MERGVGWCFLVFVAMRGVNVAVFLHSEEISLSSLVIPILNLRERGEEEAGD